VAWSLSPIDRARPKAPAIEESLEEQLLAGRLVFALVLDCVPRESEASVSDFGDKGSGMATILMG
jgi:hypothetical protein